MNTTRRAALLVAGLALSAEGARAQGIDHEPLRCVLASSYPWIEATAPGAVQVVARFRTPGSKDWYTVRLLEDGERWTGALPRPASAAAFVYTLEATDAGAVTSKTPEATVRVVAAESDCGTDGVAPSVPQAAPVVEAPQGARPLPKGFGAGEPEGGGRNVGVFDISARTALLASLAVGGAAVAVGLAQSDERILASRRMEFLGSTPPPGSTISLGSFALSVRLRIISNMAITAGNVVVGLRPVGAPISPDACTIVLFGPHGGVRADVPLDVTVEQILFIRNCSGAFEVQGINAAVQESQGQIEVFGQAFPVNYSFVP